MTLMFQQNHFQSQFGSPDVPRPQSQGFHDGCEGEVITWNQNYRAAEQVSTVTAASCCSSWVTTDKQRFPEPRLAPDPDFFTLQGRPCSPHLGSVGGAVAERVTKLSLSVR